MLKLVMKGDAYTVSADGKEDKGTVKLDATKTPKHLDIVGVEGENKGKTFLAIYEFVDKDTLKACYALSGDRPTEFKTVADDGRVVLTFKRQKP